MLEMNYSDQQLSSAIASQNLRPALLEHALLTSSGFASLILRCWEEDPDRRPTMSEVVRSLTDIYDVVRKESQTNGKEFETPKTISVKVTDDVVVSWADKAKSNKRTDLNTVWTSELAAADGLYIPTVTMGIFETAGAREKMEDRHFLRPNFGGSRRVHAFGVFDGHRGSTAFELIFQFC